MKKYAAFWAVLMLFLGYTQTASAQTDYTWDDYGLTFSVPAGFSESTSNEEKFEGSSVRAKIDLFGLYPVKDETLTVEQSLEYAKMMAKEAGMDLSDTTVEEIQFNGFEGAYCEGTIAGKPTFMAVMLDPSSDLNFIVSIVHNNADVALKLLKSIKKQ